tara:strand:- start:116 stop:598 length:483 start_codon:yes stop_codon:yes gene_type:complete
MNNYSVLSSPIGDIGIRTNEIGVYMIHLPSTKRILEVQTSLNEYSPIMDQARKEISQYFFGNRESFNISIDLKMPPFYKRVLLEVLKIPFGKTNSYKQIAKYSGNIKAARAVGTANANNPIPIIIPCHRVIASDGKLGGYGGGVEMKKKLLSHENFQNKV